MFCNEGLAGLWNLLFCLSFFPRRLLALHLDVPTRSSDGNTVFVKWNTDGGDPSTVYVQIICKDHFFIPLSRPSGPVSDLQLSFKSTSSITEAEDHAGCNLFAFQSPMPRDKPIAQSETFKSLKVSPETAPVTSTRNVSPTLSPTDPIVSTRSPLLSSSTPGPAPTPTPPAITTQTSGNTSSLSAFPRPPESTSVSVTATSPATSFIPTQSASRTSNTSSRVAIIGGVTGGLVLLALFLAFGFFYLRLRRTRQLHARMLRPCIDDPGKLMPRNIFYSLFRNYNAVNTTTDPMIIAEDYHQPEGKRERFLRVQQEMNDAQRQREMLCSNLSTSCRRNAINEGPQHDLEGREVEERLRQQLERMNNRITELEAQRMEVVEPPPVYTPPPIEPTVDHPNSTPYNIK